MNATCLTSTKSSPLNVVAAFLSVAVTVGCSDRTVPGPVVGNWTTSSDGVLSVRLRAPRGEFDASEAFVIFVDLRNDSDETVNILRPFVDDYRAYCRIIIYGPSGQKVEYTGPTPDYIISPLFSSLEPGSILRGQIESRVEDFDGSEAVGDYTIEYEYWIHESDRTQAQQDGFDTFWIGRMKTQPIRVKKVVPASARSSRVHENHGEYRSGVESLRQLLPDSIMDQNGQKVDEWVYFPTTKPMRFTLSKSLGWDPVLGYRWDGVAGSWVFVPGDGSDEKVIRLNP